MGYKFNCQRCGNEIIVKYCFIGETVQCKTCKAENIVPEDTEKTTKEPRYITERPITKSDVKNQKVSEEARVLLTPVYIGPWRFLTLLGELFRVYGKNFFRLIAIVFIMFVLMFLATIPLAIAVANISVIEKYPSIFFGLYSILMSMILMPLSNCVLVYIISKQYVLKSVSIGEAYKYGFKRLGVAIGANVLRILVFFGLSITIVGIPFAIYLFFSWSFIYHAIVVEGVRSPKKAMRRSEELIEDHWWRTFGIILILNAIGTIINISLSRIPLVSKLSSAFSLPIIVVGVTILYFDMRVRKEGYTLEKLAEELKLNIPPSESKKC